MKEIKKNFKYFIIYKFLLFYYLIFLLFKLIIQTFYYLNLLFKFFVLHKLLGIYKI